MDERRFRSSLQLFCLARHSYSCLMERLCQLRPGARAAAQRRHAALQLEERRRQERQAFDLAWHARRSSRVGRAFIEQWSVCEELFAFELYQIIVHILYYVIALINGIREHSQISAAELIRTLTVLLNIFLADVKRFRYAGIAALEHLLLFICIFVNSKCGWLRCVGSCLMIVKRLSKHGVWIEC